MKTNTFAKLFTSDEYGQIVAISGDNSEGYPSIKVFMSPHPDANTCSVEPTWNNPDPEEAEKLRDERFAELNLEIAEELAEGIHNQLCQMIDGGDEE